MPTVLGHADFGQAERRFRTCRGEGTRVKQPRNQDVEVKAPIEPVLGLGEEAGPVLMDVARVVGALHRHLEVADDPIHPLEDAQFPGLAWRKRERGLLGDQGRGSAQDCQIVVT